MTKPFIVLASSSPYRRAQLRQLQLDFSCETPAIDETPLSGESPARLALRLARLKAEVVHTKLSRAEIAAPVDLVVIGSDQVADLQGRILGKPYTREGAFAQLTACSGQTVVFHTSVQVLSTKRAEAETVATHVRFRKLSAAQISRYIEKEAAFDCAGSFKCEGLGISLFEEISSQDPSALIGIPLISLTRLLLRHGIDPLAM